jgi:hypothetical protein
MRVRRPILALAFSLAFATPCVVARAEEEEERQDPLAGISGKRMLELATELSSDGMQGRKTGYEGGARAEDWVAGNFVNIGLDPMDPDGDYLDPFYFPVVHVGAPIGLSVDGKAVEYGPGFTHLLYSGKGAPEAEVVYVGYGISAPDRGWDDYAGLDVKGKIVLAIRGAPEAREGDFPEEKFIGYKSALARDRGAAGFLIAEGKMVVPGTILPKYVRQDLPALWISLEAADRILAKKGLAFADLKKARDAGEPGASFATGATVKMEVNAHFAPRARGRNAVAGIKGSDPDLRHEVVIVGGHLDHLGVDPKGQVFNGAHDNASGVAVMVHLAETLTKNRWRPKRTVVFCGFAAEEQGLSGSRWLAARPSFDHKAIVAMLNVDAVGNGKPEVAVGGGSYHPALWKRLKAAIPEPYRASLTEFRFGDNSDHWPYSVRGIPAFFAHTTGEHPHYHAVTDDAATLVPECLEAAARVVGAMLVNLGDDETPAPPGRDLAEYLLHEGVRVVEGAASAKALGALLAGRAAAADDREPFVASGWNAVIVPAGTEDDASLAAAVRDRAPVLALARSASDLTNAGKAGRVAILRRRELSASAPVPSGGSGVAWIAFDPKSVAEMPGQAVWDALTAGRILVDLTGFPATSLVEARARLKDRPATYRRVEVGMTPTMPLAELTALRRTLGPNTLFVTSSAGIATLLLTPAALTEPDDPALAPVALTCEDTALLRNLLAASIEEAGAEWADPEHPVRRRIRSLLGGAWVDLLRRL